MPARVTCSSRRSSDDQQQPLRILIAEDDQDFRDSLSLLLGRAGYAVDAAPNGIAALEKAAAADVLLTDVCMPGLNGYDLLSEVHRLHPELHVIIMTAYGSVDHLTRARRMGARAYFAKPFQPAHLLEHLDKLASVM